MGKPQVSEWGTRPFLHSFFQWFYLLLPQEKVFSKLCSWPCTPFWSSLSWPPRPQITLSSQLSFACKLLQILTRLSAAPTLTPGQPHQDIRQEAQRQGAQFLMSDQCPFNLSKVCVILSFPAHVMFVTGVTNAMVFPCSDLTTPTHL